MSEKPIIFKNRMVNEIISNRKKETRRLSKRFKKGDILWVKENYSSRKFNIPSDLRWITPLYMPKNQARVWLRVTAVRSEKLLDIDEDSARREGFNSRKEFISYFNELNKKKETGPNPTVQVVSFDVIRVGKIGKRIRDKKDTGGCKDEMCKL